jgi:hypothetical protein
MLQRWGGGGPLFSYLYKGVYLLSPIVTFKPNKNILWNYLSILLLETAEYLLL